MNLQPVLELLKLKIGLNPESIGSASIEKSVRDHMKEAGVASIGDYITLINRSSAALQRLVDATVISETSFFRNRTPFLALKKYLEQFVLNKRHERHIRILCLPCSTGEEPYSIAMVLLDMKIPPNQFHICAGDISEQALQFAQAGVYTAYSFRGDDLDYRTTYFSKQENNYILNQEVHDAVHFENINILSDHFLPGHKPYDIIFCRNLLIYFDDDTKGKAIKALSSRLSEHGVLFVGHAEGAKLYQYGYASLNYAMSFAFARKDYAKAINEVLNPGSTSNNTSPVPAPVSPPAIQAKSFRPPERITPAITRPLKKIVTEASEKKEPEAKGLSQARQLAEKGTFDEVGVICEKLLSEGADSAEVYYLLGQTGEATGNSLMAEEYLKKAIYLDADFYEALIHLSQLYKQMGNTEKAEIFRKRAERVKSRKQRSEH